MVGHNTKVLVPRTCYLLSPLTGLAVSDVPLCLRDDQPGFFELLQCGAGWPCMSMQVLLADPLQRVLGYWRVLQCFGWQESVRVGRKVRQSPLHQAHVNILTGALALLAASSS